MIRWEIADYLLRYVNLECPCLHLPGEGGVESTRKQNLSVCH
jgi:hypothetical protein